MKKLMTFCLLIAMALPVAAVEGDQVLYVGGSDPTMHAGVIGRLDTTSETSLKFEYSGTRLYIPYADIQSHQYTTEVAHHLGVLPGIAVALLKKRERRHFFRISYSGTNHAPQVAVFEVPKSMPRTLQAVLEARAPQTHRPNSACGCQTGATPCCVTSENVIASPVAPVSNR